MTRGITVNCGESDRLRPPGRIAAMAKEIVNQCVVKALRTDQVFAKFFDGLRPIIRPQTGPVVYWALRGASDLLETQDR